MKTRKIISTLLAVLMLMSSFSLLASADGETGTEAPVYTYNTSSAKDTLDYMTGKLISGVEEKNNEKVYTYTGEVIQTPEDKLKTMDLRLEKDGYRLYVDAYSGEVATYCIATGEILFSNPYDVGRSNATASIKSQLLSQIVVKYTDIATDTENTYYSYEWCASRGQINVKNVKNGIRVEYTIGREETRMLVPRQIKKETFEKKILNVVAEQLGTTDFTYKKLTSYYLSMDPSAPNQPAAAITEMQKNFPITKKMAVYVLDSSTTSAEMARVEIIIKTYCPGYSYEDLDEDHLEAEYESEDENPPLFKMALEYTLDEMGMSVRLPANGIRFNESLYRLYSIEILPYMGAGESPAQGYTFFPDGSGTLFDFEKIQEIGTSTTVTGKVYGQDYAYHTITGTHQEIIRYPVYGIVENQRFVDVQPDPDDETGKKTIETVTGTQYRGFLAIVEEGDAMMELSSYHEVRSHKYNTVKITVYPRPQDTYNIADAISVGTNDTWTVVSSRKYSGNYKIRYVMLTSDEVAQNKQITDYYPCTYVGMALAYRDYLVDTGVLTKLTSEDVGEDIPLFIKTFGTIETTEKILSIPVKVMTPLTTFEDIKTMYGDLSAKGIENVNFILTGYANGGMSSTVPYKLKWESSVGGKSGFEDLVNYAKEKNFGIFPDFDFVYISNNSLFDGATLKTHAVKTIDNRYTSKREYSATKQTYISYFELAVSPAYFSHFYEKLTKNYMKYNPLGISVSTLGSSLNSDFDEDEPYNREDSKEFTVQAFEYLRQNYSKVMTSGGNSYTWKYIDYITDIALDSSRYSQSAAAVPFLGIVLHGYVQFAGTPINMEGNIEYSLLKAIENGAALNFLLSYQNTENLKDDERLSQYYSVRYDIWFDDVVSIYNELNSQLAGLQTSLIVDHKFITGSRVPDDDEIIADAEAAMKDAIAKEQELLESSIENERKALLEARKGIIANKTALETLLDGTSKKLLSLNSIDIDAFVTAYNTAKGEADAAKTADDAAKLDYETKQAELDAMKVAVPAPSADELTAKEAEVKSAKDAYAATTKTLTEKTDAASAALLNVRNALTSVYTLADSIVTSVNSAKALYEQSVSYLNLLKSSGTISAEAIADLEVIVNASKPVYDDIAALKVQSTAAALAGYNKVKAIEGIEMSEYTEGITIVPPTPGESDDDDDDSDVDTSVTADKYESDANKIAIVTYDNGTSFVLNFNNYAVITTVNGNVYTIAAYGYVVIKAANS